MDPRESPLGKRDLDVRPLVQFRRWFAEAAPLVRAPEAMALSSPQSAPVESRAWLEARVAALEAEGEPARPAIWGGYRLVPDAWEVWQHRANRLHDRFRYRPEGGGWVIERLAP